MPDNILKTGGIEQQAQPAILFGNDGAVYRSVKVDSNGNICILGTSVPFAYDYRAFGYTGDNITTITYYTGGAGGTLVATETLAYDINNNLISITRT